MKSVVRGLGTLMVLGLLVALGSVPVARADCFEVCLPMYKAGELVVFYNNTKCCNPVPEEGPTLCELDDGRCSAIFQPSGTECSDDMRIYFTDAQFICGQLIEGPGVWCVSAQFWYTQYAFSGVCVGPNDDGRCECGRYVVTVDEETLSDCIPCNE